MRKAEGEGVESGGVDGLGVTDRLLLWISQARREEQRKRKILRRVSRCDGGAVGQRRAYMMLL